VAEAYLRAKFHRDPSHRLATIHQRYREDRQDNGPITYSQTVLLTIAQKVKGFPIIHTESWARS